MSDVGENIENQDSTKEVPQDYKALYEKEVPAMKAKMQELLDEAKASKKSARELAEKTAAQENEKARQNGEFEKLLKISEERQKEVENKYKELLTGIRSEKIKNASMNIASKLAKGDNIELLNDFIERKLTSLADDDGKVSDDVLEAVKRDFETNSKYASLVAGRQSSGGGASGSNGIKTKVVSSEEFRKWDSVKQMQFIKDGNRLQD